MGRATYYSERDYLQQTDQETGSSFWAVHGEKMSFTYFEVPPYKEFKNHSHENEQITYVFYGQLYFEVGNKVYCLNPGDTIIIPPNIEHRVWTENMSTKAVDSWSPVRK